MAELEITDTALIVHITGADQFFALKTQLEVPLEHIARIDPNPAEAHRLWHGLRMGGTNVPGLITAGRFLQGGEWAFWDVHDPDKAIAIYLHDERYSKLVIGVDDPQLAAATLTAPVERARKSKPPS